MRILIRNGYVLDPGSGRAERTGVLTENDKIIMVGKDIPEEADRIIDASGCYVMPGFIDLHVHLRDPGLTYKETLATGGRAAAKGGVTTICAMPNTRPVIDTALKVSSVMERAKKESPVHVIQLGSITREQLGEELSDIAGMAKAGCKAISEDGKSVRNAALYAKAMRIAKDNNLAVFAHCEDKDLAADGVMHAGKKALELGFAGIPYAAEDVITARDILLCMDTGVRLHLCHCSTKRSVEMAAAAKKAGYPVTAEACPHHFTLTTGDIPGDYGDFKMNPPIREKEDAEAIKEGLRTGTIDAIATDHAPHADYEKECSMKDAAFGIVGLETMAALTYTELVVPGIISPIKMAELTSYNPAKILGLSDRGMIMPGKMADIVVFNPDKEYDIDKDKFLSKGRNTPFNGRRVRGLVQYTIAGGTVVHEDS